MAQCNHQPASEFTMGFFSKCFPDLFPDGRGDITKPRMGKNPSNREYFKHLMRVSRAFVEHHCFTFVATNMLRRHEALTRGNVFARHCTANLTMEEMKRAVDTNDFRVINKLLYFAAPIPGTRQYFRYMSDKAISFVKWLRIKSGDQKMFNFFQTFSAADLHWDDLHRLLPDSERYLGKTVVDSLESVPEEDRDRCITSTEDCQLRIANIKRHADIVDAYFKHRIDLLLKKVLPVMGAREFVCRYEVQARGTIHAHILLHVEDGPSHQQLLDAFGFSGAANISLAPVKVSALGVLVRVGVLYFSPSLEVSNDAFLSLLLAKLVWPPTTMLWASPLINMYLITRAGRPQLVLT